MKPRATAFRMRSDKESVFTRKSIPPTKRKTSIMTRGATMNAMAKASRLRVIDMMRILPSWESKLVEPPLFRDRAAMAKPYVFHKSARTVRSHKRMDNRHSQGPVSNPSLGAYLLNSLYRDCCLAEMMLLPKLSQMRLTRLVLVAASKYAMWCPVPTRQFTRCLRSVSVKNGVLSSLHTRTQKKICATRFSRENSASKAVSRGATKWPANS
mmetsp:Transcript_145038/g.404025  ORF Transcript_145038/g.404025 Transcript_145038/m.404025 type:complete len:211 (+) Transcript_145038:2595-3227(+)